MRILQVVHDFLPNHVAGVEIYADTLSRGLAADHIVAILYSEVVAEAPNYSVHRARRGKVVTFELVNNHEFNHFEETYINRQVDQRVKEVLDGFRPDVIHVQHLLNLSINLVSEAHRRGIPVVMTLHDHWISCARGGQRFHRKLDRCDVLDPSRCGACTANMHGLNHEENDLSRRLAKLANNSGLSLADRQPDEVETVGPSYVYQDQYMFDGEALPTWVAHPPSQLFFRARVKEGATFTAAVAMHPNTFECEGGGVRFAVAVNGEERFSRVVDPKRLLEDRVPLPVSVPLGEGKIDLELRTEAVPSDDSAFCTAGWIEPYIHNLDAREAASSVALRRLTRGALSLASWPQSYAQRRRIGRRWAAMRKMADQIDLMIAPSRYLREEFIRFGIDAKKIKYSDYGFDVDGFQPRTDLPDYARRFAFVGSLVKHKGLHILLEAFRALPPEAELRVYGSLDYDKGYVARLRAEANHPGVQFMGGVPNGQIPEILAEVDCLVVPSIWTENSPLTIHEAFLAGVPVVASRLGGNVGLLDEGGGLLYEADDPEDLAIQLRRLHDEEGLLVELAEGIPEVKAMDDHIEEMLGIYRKLLDQCPRG